jgi:ribonuclease P protein component
MNNQFVKTDNAGKNLGTGRTAPKKTFANTRKKIAVLKQNKQFQWVFGRGVSCASPCLVTYVLRNNLKFSRVGITASKKVGIAVKRNRARRIINQAYMKLCERVGRGFDIVFLARHKTCALKTQDVFVSMLKHLRGARVIWENSQSK